MADIVSSMPLPVFAVDRLIFASRAELVETITNHLKNGAIVQVEDSSRPRAMKLCYEIRLADGSSRLFNAHGRQIGVYASVAALVDHAEAATAV